uniref:Uncharacterized protein n=1 Tax=Trichuris muris TaxID=70415 RepID=A0A5S6R3M2_TRIMR
MRSYPVLKHHIFNKNLPSKKRAIKKRVPLEPFPKLADGNCNTKHQGTKPPLSHLTPAKILADIERFEKGKRTVNDSKAVSGPNYPYHGIRPHGNGNAVKGWGSKNHLTKANGPPGSFTRTPIGRLNNTKVPTTLISQRPVKRYKDNRASIMRTAAIREKITAAAVAMKNAY